MGDIGDGDQEGMIRRASANNERWRANVASDGFAGETGRGDGQGEGGEGDEGGGVGGVEQPLLRSRTCKARGPGGRALLALADAGGGKLGGGAREDGSCAGGPDSPARMSCAEAPAEEVDLAVSVRLGESGVELASAHSLSPCRSFSLSLSQAANVSKGAGAVGIGDGGEVVGGDVGAGLERGDASLLSYDASRRDALSEVQVCQS